MNSARIANVPEVPIKHRASVPGMILTSIAIDDPHRTAHWFLAISHEPRHAKDGGESCTHSPYMPEKEIRCFYAQEQGAARALKRLATYLKNLGVKILALPYGTASRNDNAAPIDRAFVMIFSHFRRARICALL